MRVVIEKWALCHERQHMARCSRASGAVLLPTSASNATSRAPRSAISARADLRLAVGASASMQWHDLGAPPHPGIGWTPRLSDSGGNVLSLGLIFPDRRSDQKPVFIWLVRCRSVLRDLRLSHWRHSDR